MRGRPLLLVPFGLALLLVVAAGPAHAFGTRSFTWTGNNQFGHLWHRPIGTGPSLTSAQERWDVQTVELSKAAFCTLSSSQDFDGDMYLYGPCPPDQLFCGFSSVSPLVSLLAANDNGGFGVGDSYIAFDAQPGVYNIVISGHNAADVGTYSTRLDCNNDVRISHGFCLQWIPGVPESAQVCLDGFAVAIVEVSGSQTGGYGLPVPQGSRDSAFFWFYQPTNFEAVVKVLDACAINHHFWVFVGGLTDQHYKVLVRRPALFGGQAILRTYENQLGVRSPAFTDTQAFPCLEE